jgi:condensation domain-containing protein
VQRRRNVLADDGRVASPEPGQRPLTVQQRAMLDFIGTRVDDYYINLEAFHACGPFDLSAFRGALSAVVARHEAIRSIFPARGDCREVLPATDGLTDSILLVTRDVPGVASAIRAGAAWAGAAMALDRRPALRVWIGRIGPADTVLVFAGHYLVFDAWSFMLFYEDLAVQYGRARGGGHPVKPAPQYGDVLFESSPGALDGWSGLFGRPYVKLRELRRRTPSRLGPGNVLVRRGAVDGSVEEAAKAWRVSPFVLGAAAMLRTVSDTLHDSQVIIGSAHAGRMTADAVRAIGYAATTIFLGADLARTTAAGELIKQLNDQLMRWHGGERIQWQPLLEHYRATDAYAVKFAFQPDSFARPQLTLEGLSTERLRLPPATTARRPVDLLAAYGDGVVTAQLRYRTDVVPGPAAEHLLDRFFARLEEICAASGPRRPPAGG